MGNDSDGRPAGETLLVLVTGLPGTGKSTVAEAVAQPLEAAVLGHDWVMSGLRPFPELQAVLDAMEPSGHRVVGWSVLNALARAQLRQGRSVVLDGVARPAEIEACRETARSESVRLEVLVTRCSDLTVHRSRIEQRRRLIPHWYELEWSDVERSMAHWVHPDSVDLDLDTAEGWDVVGRRLQAHFGRG